MELYHWSTDQDKGGGGSSLTNEVVLCRSKRIYLDLCEFRQDPKSGKVQIQNEHCLFTWGRVLPVCQFPAPPNGRVLM